MVGVCWRIVMTNKAREVLVVKPVISERKKEGRKEEEGGEEKKNRELTVKRFGAKPRCESAIYRWKHQRTRKPKRTMRRTRNKAAEGARRSCPRSLPSPPASLFFLFNASSHLLEATWRPDGGSDWMISRENKTASAPLGLLK